MNSENLISVIIVTFHSEKVIYECIDSLLKYNDIGDKLEIIVIDNSTIDVYKRMSKKILKDYQGKVKSFKSPGNIGYGRANNLGAEISSGEILLFLNPDAIFVMPIFTKIYACFLKDKKVSTAGIQLICEKKIEQISYIFIKGYISPLLGVLVKILNKLNYKLPNMITSGSCFFVRREIFSKVGGFNEKIFLYQEESYLAKKIKKLSKNLKLVFLHDLKIIHREKSEKMSEILLKEHYKSTLFYYKYFGYKTWITKIIYNIFFILKKCTLFLKNNNYELKYLKKEMKIFNSIFENV